MKHLPNTITLLNLATGFLSVLMAFEGRLHFAALLILVCALLDFLDGTLAKLLNAVSRLGKQLDSLADIISFGMAPAIMTALWGFQTPSLVLNRVGWLAAFMFLVAGAIRLARFNVDDSRSRYFTGLPIPAAAAAIAAIVYLKPVARTVQWQAFLTLALILILSSMMVSPYRFWSFKEANFRNPKSYLLIIPIALMFITISFRSVWVK